MRYFLAKGAALKWLETPSIYHSGKDELYELDEEAFGFIEKCASAAGCDVPEDEFIRFCVSEGVLTTERDSPERKTPPPEPRRSPVPSLRYLELQITDQCNLRCRHCYIGDSLNNHELSPEQVREVLAEFEQMQGLRVLLTGGEPLLHSRFSEINSLLPEFSVRKVLFTNGILVRKDMVGDLNIDEIQVSLDGMESAHDLVRGKGAFSAAMRAVRSCLDAGLEVSVSTMVHAGNLGDFDEMDRLFREIGILDWTVDVPCSAGRLKDNSLLQVSPEQGGKLLKYGFGGGIHSSSPGYGCGFHLMSVSADGRASKCTFYADRPVGLIGEGLRNCWQKIQPVRLSELACDCAYIEECRGGCRYRAGQSGDVLGRDLYRCYFYDIMEQDEDKRA